MSTTENAITVPKPLIVSAQPLNPHSYVEGMTGKCYIGNAIRNESVVSDINYLLSINRVKAIANFALDEIEFATEAGKQIVLVDCSYYKGNQYITNYRWFQVNQRFIKTL